MANVSKTVEIIFEGTDRVSKTIDTVERNMSAFSRSVSGVADPLAGVAKGVLAFEAALAALAGGALAVSVTAAGQFSDQIADISTITPLAGQSLDAYKGKVLAYAQDSTQSIESINGALYNAISAGVDYEKSIQFVTDAEKLAVAGKADLNATTMALIQTLNAYGESTDSAGRFSDVLFKTVELGVTTIPELASSLSNVTSIAATAGVPIETLGAAIATLTFAGKPTAEAITGIKAALDNIIKPSSQAREEAERLGVKFDATALQTLGFEGVLANLNKANGGNISSFSKLFGSVEALGSVMVLSSTNADRFNETLTAMQGATGATQAAYDKMASGFEATNQKLANNVQAVLIAVGAELTGTYADIAAGLVEVFQGIGQGITSENFQGIFDAIDGLGEGIAAALKELGKNLPDAMELLDFDALLKSFKGLGGALSAAFEAIFGQIDVSGPESIARAMQRMVDAITALQNVTKGIVQGLTPFFKLISEGIDEFSKSGDAAQEFAGQVLGLATSISTLLEYSGGIIAFMGVFSGATIINAGINLANFSAGLYSAAANSGALATAGAALVPVLGVGLAGAIGYTVGTLLNEYVPGVEAAAQALLKVADKALDFTGTQGIDFDKVDADFERARSQYLLLQTTRVEQHKAATEEEVKDFNYYLQQVKDSKIVTEVKAKVNEKSVSDAYIIINAGLPDEKIIPIKTNADKKSLDQSNKTLDEEIPAVKRLEIQAEIDVARIKAASEVVQTSIEWKAKLDIAQVEANAEKVKAAFESISATITSTGDVISTLFGLLESGGGFNSQIERQIQLEEERRQKAFEQQQKLVDVQIEESRARADRFRQGGMEITFDSSSIAPHLEAILWELLSAIQLRVNEDQGAYLLGLGS